MNNVESSRNEKDGENGD